ncbi:uncharacterized protein LOC132179641 isoform X2 [Corylus avellana]|uniref:uncharacterized protein LOC132179641 isoform X2 n=1 Tax=Corylus avellana TaxID=13451 RepID=UPI00286C21FA|nr:uncharacterized protein LOC132179641 isoform X2 [Corylus avellana]
MVFHSLCPSVSQVVTLSFPAMQWAWNIGMEGKGYLPNQWVEPSAAQSMVIPTIYTDIRGRMIQSNQYSGTEHFWSSESGYFFQSLPGIFFFYDISPVKKKNYKCTLS